MQTYLKNRIAKNAGWIILCKSIEAVLGLVVSMIVARHLMPDHYGLINYAASLVTFVTPLAQLGFKSVLVQETISYPEKEGMIFGSSLVVSFLSSLICVAAIVLFVHFSSPGEALTVMVCMLYSIMLPMQSIELIQYWFQAKLLSKYPALLTLIAYFLICVYQVILVVTGKSVSWFAVSKALEYFIISAGLLIFYKRHKGRKLVFSWSIVLKLFNKSKHFMISSLLVMTFAQADRVMIKMMLGNTAMGYYSAAVVVTNLTEFIFLAVIDSFRPIILEKRKAFSTQYEKYMTVLYSLMIALSFLQSLAITLLARPLILFLYGESYLPAVPALRIIVWYTAFSYMGTIRNIWILAEDKQHLLWLINLCGAVCNIVLNAVMIPIMGIAGAALTSLITQIFTNFIIGFCMKSLRENNRLLVASLNFVRSAKMFKEIFTLNERNGE